MEHFQPTYYNAGGTLSGIEYFDRFEEDDEFTLWEIQLPGLTSEQTWACSFNPASCLDEAVELILPEYAEYGLTLDSAAKLLVRLKIVRGTSVSVDELELKEPAKVEAAWTRYATRRDLHE